MVDEAQMRDAIEAVSAYVDREFSSASTAHDRDFERSAHTWSIREAADGPVFLLIVSFEFLSDTPPAEIGRRLGQWDVANTLRAVAAGHRVLVTTGGVTTIPR